MPAGKVPALGTASELAPAGTVAVVSRTTRPTASYGERVDRAHGVEANEVDAVGSRRKGCYLPGGIAIGRGHVHVIEYVIVREQRRGLGSGRRAGANLHFHLLGVVVRVD
nr:hypothetical protein [Tanacetum cinerariifolium]